MANVQEGGTVTSALVTSGIKSTKATIRIDDLKDVVGQNGQAEIANYLDGQSEYASLSLSLCACVRARARARVCVCVCVWYSKDWLLDRSKWAVMRAILMFH